MLESMPLGSGSPLVSVVLCSYNPTPEYFTKTLSALKEQTLSVDAWELIIVDNNSSLPIASQFPIDWHPRVRWLREDAQGKIFALISGIKASKGNLIITIDDDCLPSPDYLELALGISREHPNIGTFGAGTITPLFESDPAPWFMENPSISGLLAIRTLEAVEISSSYELGQKPWGLGLCVTKNVTAAWLNWCENDMDKALHLRGRKATVLEDDFFSLCAVHAGMSYGIFPTLTISHIIPTSRLLISYLSAHAYDHGYSAAQLAFLKDLSCHSPDPPVTMVRLLKPLLKLKRSEFLHELKRLRAQLGEPAPVRKLRKAREEGWRHAARDYQHADLKARLTTQFQCI